MDNFWEKRWQNQQTGWDLGQPSPPIIAYASQIPVKKRNLKVLIPGCGNGYEALWLLENGFTNVTMLDIAPTAVELMQKRMDSAYPNWEEKLSIICGDFFKHKKQYDLIFEQTFFCALNPSLRASYIQQMHNLLIPKGKIAGVMFNRVFEGGPPFGGSIKEYEALFSPFFAIKTMETCHNSIEPRSGAEIFVLFEKTA